MDEHQQTASNTQQSRRRQFTLFASNFLKHPKMLGSIIPSSPFLVRRMLSHVDWERTRVLVEYGPGIGTFTKEILRQMHPDAVLLVLETNKDFVDYINGAFSDPRMQVVHGSAADIQQVLNERELGAVDYVVAGIPFSTLPDVARENILDATRQVISPDGTFLLYQFSPNILPSLHKTFSQVTREFEPMNFLPAHFYRCRP
ncbi:class I SAM-dependent methyltransferase [Chromohalobacter canadensis]|uniref:Phospholipid N-methyltransferase n=1 Tax=Chromohalobacter canadensis TaxID=141389 RepID=A0A285VNA1_9GAMM|nr:rRNA adenine N-6-methyltransferase family protein [Chromohalobacter canadensis]MCK0769777.1 methyltransferase [Chromohalobacter canadensis]MCT8467270.1 methyltransferase [Chromohalobacter canadensis]MCT8470982.1 methyltransferase [Chromohalobacter canadensis]MCT8497767.1 methyltransferase [Chromohalobacter canadensis]WQH08086.1 rRNA adenine N-6-methyltransferase family protein [Chromohalobacter canadensis]